MSHGTRPVREPDDETAARGSVSAYLDAVLRRASVPMETEPFRPDWADRPRSHKVYEGLPAFPLPAQGPVPPAPLASALDPDRTPAAPDPGLTLPALAGMLRHSYGWLSRRLGVNADPGQVGREEYERATWGRGSAAGGGLYPCEIYWVCGPGAGPLPGVYHYDQPAHALRRLAVGDASPRVREALCGAPAGSQFLLVTVRFWQNAFKYGEFSYHCVTMDLGCLLHTWQTWAKGYGIRLRPSLWFDEPDLDALLGLDLVRESVLAAVPLPWATPTTARPSPSPSSSPSSSSFEATASAPSFEVTATDTERSRTVRRFPAAERAHLAAAYDPRPRPAATALAAAAVGPPSAPGHAPADSREAAPLRLPAPTPLPGGTRALD